MLYPWQKAIQTGSKEAKGYNRNDNDYQLRAKPSGIFDANYQYYLDSNRPNKIQRFKTTWFNIKGVICGYNLRPNGIRLLKIVVYNPDEIS